MKLLKYIITQAGGIIPILSLLANIILFNFGGERYCLYTMIPSFQIARTSNNVAMRGVCNVEYMNIILVVIVALFSIFGFYTERSASTGDRAYVLKWGLVLTAMSLLMAIMPFQWHLDRFGLLVRLICITGSIVFVGFVIATIRDMIVDKK